MDEASSIDNHEVSAREVANATAMFEQMDQNGDGVIDMIEFQSMMEMVAHRTGRHHTFDGIRRMFLEADTNQDGVIDFQEFVAMSRRKRNKGRRTEGAATTTTADTPRARQTT